MSTNWQGDYGEGKTSEDDRRGGMAVIAYLLLALLIVVGLLGVTAGTAILSGMGG